MGSQGPACLISPRPTFQLASVLQLREGLGVCASLLRAWDRTGGPCRGQVKEGCLSNSQGEGQKKPEVEEAGAQGVMGEAQKQEGKGLG